MKQFVVGALLTLTLVLVAKGQTANLKLSKDDQIKNDLMQLERDIGKANIANDYAFFDRVEADEFIFTDAGGALTTRSRILRV